MYETRKAAFGRLFACLKTLKNPFAAKLFRYEGKWHIKNFVRLNA